MKKEIALSTYKRYVREYVRMQVGDTLPEVRLKKPLSEWHAKGVSVREAGMRVIQEFCRF